MKYDKSFSFMKFIFCEIQTLTHFWLYCTLKNPSSRNSKCMELNVSYCCEMYNLEVLGKKFYFQKSVNVFLYF